VSAELKCKWIAPLHDVMIVAADEEEILAFRRAERARITTEVEQEIREDLARFLGHFVDEKRDVFITNPTTVRHAVWSDWVPKRLKV
jgi:hypothetical protein